MNREALTTKLAFAVSVLALSAAAHGQGPAGSTGECKDGTFSSAATKSGACAGHGGVKEWFEPKKGGKVESDSPAAALKPTPAASAPSASAPAGKTAAKPSEMPTVAAAGGGPGKVWVNTSSKVYHCSTDKWYGKTKKGEYMSEADAKAKGNHADHGKACG